jgi:hypothetical protein
MQEPAGNTERQATQAAGHAEEQHAAKPEQLHAASAMEGAAG